MNGNGNASEEDGSTSTSDSDSVELLTETTSLGTHRGYRVFIGPSRDPEGARVPDEFGANLFIPNADGENVNIARIDTAHDGCHIDRLYLPEGHRNRRQDYSVDVFNPKEALEFFLEGDKWKRMVEKYERNHGLPEKPTERDRD